MRTARELRLGCRTAAFHSAVHRCCVPDHALSLGGVAILSGLLRTQERRVSAAYLSRGFVLERRIHRDAWSALVLRRVG